MKSYALILGGGSGSRMDAGVNKIFLPLRGIPAIVRAIAPFSALCSGAVVVASKGEEAQMLSILSRFGLSRFVLSVVVGGEDRQASVANGLAALPGDAEIVLVHDGARALISEKVIVRVLESVAVHGSGVAAVPVSDTVKRASASGEVLETLNRDELYAMQTPQGFLVKALREAHQKATQENYRATDDAALLEHAGMPVYLVQGDRENLKLTTPFDLALADVILARRNEQEND